MTPEQRAELRKAPEEATPGPWTVNGKQSVRGSFGEYIAKTNWLNGANNARHIAAANPATILQLLDYVESLERDAARYRYLRDDGEGFDISVLERDTEDGELWVHGYPPEELDAAIDAAMGESK